jgi:Putative adhesin
MTTRTRSLLMILAAAFIASVALSAEKTFDKRFDVAPGGHLRLDADFGSVNLVGGAGHEVAIHAQMDGSDAFLAHLDITAEQASSGVTVTARAGHGSWFDWFGFGERRMRFTIEVPRDYSVELRTAGGYLDVRNLNAPVRGATSGGSIVVRDVTGPVEMHTSGGSIAAERLNGTTELRTSGGSISVTDATGDLDVHTSGGGIHLMNIDASVTAATSGGSVHAEVRSNRGISLSTSGGTIGLLLPGNVGASIDASTSGGRVYWKLPLSSTEAVDHSHLRGVLNGGGKQVVLHTSGGNIDLGPLT